MRWWGAAAPGPLAFFCFSASTTHLLSALGHVYPDSHSLEKADHLGIVMLIVGNPLSSLMVRLSRGGASTQFHSTGTFHLGHHNAHHRQPAVQPHGARSRRSRRLYRPDLSLALGSCVGCRPHCTGIGTAGGRSSRPRQSQYSTGGAPNPFVWLVRAFECCCAAQAIEHGHVPVPMYVIAALLLGGAFFPPAPRVGAFTVGILAIVALFGKEVR